MVAIIASIRNWSVRELELKLLSHREILLAEIGNCSIAASYYARIMLDRSLETTMKCIFSRVINWIIMRYFITKIKCFRKFWRT